MLLGVGWFFWTGSALTARGSDANFTVKPHHARTSGDGPHNIWTDTQPMPQDMLMLAKQIGVAREAHARSRSAAI